MRRTTILAIALLLPVVSLIASPVTKDAAKATATAFLQQQVKMASGRNHAPQRLELVSAEPENSAYYVFNNQNGQGFAIVSGEDTADGAILGYSTEGKLSQENMPEALRAALNDYATVVKFAQQNGLSMQKAPRKATRQDVSHFVNFSWNQNGVYSQNCPTDCSTGCMAVTMAMIVAYYKYPETLPAVWNSNVSSSEQASNEAWNPGYTSFLSSYSTYSTLGEMPRFMRHVADALNTNYSTSGSGVSGGGGVFVTAMTNFGYDPAMRIIQRDAYSAEDWDDMMYNEVSNSRPVMFYGDHSQLGGHSYLTDGYQTSTGFYYINWGWGGTCNGWFDLGILNPFVAYFSSWSSMGYDCPPSGFTSGLKAIIGIQQKPEGEVEEAVELITTDDMRFESSQIVATVFNYNDRPYTGAIRWAILAGDATFTLLDGNETTLNNLSLYTYARLNPSNLDLADGTYRLVPVCKKTTETEWNLCEGYKQKYADVTFADGQVSVDVHPITNKVIVENVCYYGNTGYADDQYLEYIVTLRNDGDDVYDNIKITGVRSDGKRVSGSSMNIGVGAGKTNTFSLFLEKGTGFNSLTDPTYEVTIQFDNKTIWTGNLITSKSYANYTTYTGVEFEDFEYVDGNAYLYSTSLTGDIFIKNENSSGSSYYVFNGPIRITLKDENSQIVHQTVEQYIVEKKATQAYPVNFEGLQSGKKYYLTLEAVNSTRSSSSYSVSVDKTYFSNFEITVVVGIPYVDENGVLQRATEADDVTGKFNLPANTAAVDFRKFDADVVNLSSITNENCLYIFPAGANVPEELEGKNVVVGNTAETLTLVDGKPVAFPVEFTAAEATYTRNVTNDHWNTIVVPFTATVKVEGEDADIDWFRRGEPNGRKFWLYKFNGSDPSSVYFDAETATVMNANEPYLIAVPGDKWGETYDLRKNLVFHGENVTISGDAPEKKVGNGYTFKGTYGSASFSHAYKLNEAGDFFELTEDGTENPFHAYFESLESATSSKKAVTVIFGDVPTLIMNVEDARQNVESIFDLQGRRVQNAQKGIYIRNGKKVVVK